MTPNHELPEDLIMLLSGASDLELVMMLRDSMAVGDELTYRAVHKILSERKPESDELPE